MERQATQPAAVPTGRKRRRVCGKKKNLEEPKAQALDMQATQPPTSELVIALKALPRAEDPPPPPPSQTVNELMECTLKDYEEECVEEGTVPSQLTTEVGDSEEQALDQMEANLNDLLYEACPFHPHQFIHCVNPQTEFGQLRYKCPQEGCPVYLFENTRFVILEKLKEDTHPQVRAQLQRGLLKCQCGFTPKMKLSRTTKNYHKVFLSCGSFLPGQEPCGYFRWLHGPLWRPREQAQPSLRRWVKETSKRECTLLQGSRPPPEKALSGHWERRSHRWPPTPGVALWEGTLLCVRGSISTSPAKAQREAVVESVCGIGCSPGERG